MIIIEAIEALKCGFSVVAYNEYEIAAVELFKLVLPTTIELYYPDSDCPVDIMTLERFRETYSNVEFTVYNIKTT